MPSVPTRVVPLSLASPVFEMSMLFDLGIFPRMIADPDVVVAFEKTIECSCAERLVAAVGVVREEGTGAAGDIPFTGFVAE